MQQKTFPNLPNKEILDYQRLIMSDWTLQQQTPAPRKLCNANGTRTRNNHGAVIRKFAARKEAQAEEV
jgi:hypothetical protein